MCGTCGCKSAETKKRKTGFRKCSKCGDSDHNSSNCNRLNEYEEYLKHKDEMLRQCDRAIDEFTSDAKDYSEYGEYGLAKMLRSDATDMKKLKRMIEKNHFGKATHFAMGMDSQPRDLAPSALWLFASENEEVKLSKNSCCCGADEANPCACMKAPEPMECSAKAPKCACYKALEKNAEGSGRIDHEGGRMVSINEVITIDYTWRTNEEGDDVDDYTVNQEVEGQIEHEMYESDSGYGYVMVYDQTTNESVQVDYNWDKTTEDSGEEMIKSWAESFETEESYDEPSYCQNCDWEGLTSELVWDFEGRKKYGPAQCPKCSYISYVWTGEEPAWLQAESFEAPKPKDPPYVINGRKRIKTWKEIARGYKKEYDYENWREADKQLDYLKGIHEYLEDCTDEEFEDFFTNIDDPTISNFAFDYKRIWGDIKPLGIDANTDRDEMLNNMGDYRNALRREQEYMFPESFYDAETFEAPIMPFNRSGRNCPSCRSWSQSFIGGVCSRCASKDRKKAETFEASVIRQGDAPKGAMAKAMMNKAMMEQANIEAMIQELENKVNLGLINEDELMKSLKKKFGAEYDIEVHSSEELLDGIKVKSNVYDDMSFEPHRYIAVSFTDKTGEYEWKGIFYYHGINLQSIADGNKGLISYDPKTRMAVYDYNGIHWRGQVNFAGKNKHYFSSEELSKEDLEAYFADLKKDNPKLAKILEFNVKNEEYLPKMLIESSGYDYEILEAWNDSIIDDDKYALFDPCKACEGEGWIMTSYTPATRWDPADGDGEDCGECGGSGKIDPSDYMYYDDKGDIQYEAETKISKTCPNCEKYGRDATTDYICDFCAQCKRCCETSYGCYDVAICNDCDGSFIGKDIDGCCGSCDNCCECGDY